MFTFMLTVVTISVFSVWIQIYPGLPYEKIWPNEAIIRPDLVTRDMRATLKAGIRKPESGNQKPESGIRNPESGIKNDDRKIHFSNV